MTHDANPRPSLRLVVPPVDDNSSAQPAKGKPRPSLFRALGKAEPPDHVEVGGTRYELVEVLKHDSWAATAIYASAAEKIVCKFNRQQRIGLLPMRWLGRKLAGRENYLLRRLADLPNVPAYRGPVTVNGVPQSHVASHVFVEGHPLKKGDATSDTFFQELHDTLAIMHARGIAYVDLHKAENILVGDDGRSYLIDFQVCYIRPRNRLLAWFMGYAERMLKDMDFYHYRKHLCYHRPDLAGYTIKELHDRNDRPWWIKAHRAVAVPLRTLRRRLLVLIGIRKGKGSATTEHFAEDAVRRHLEPSVPAECDLQRRAA